MNILKSLLLAAVFVFSFSQVSRAGSLSAEYADLYKEALETIVRIDISRLGTMRDGDLAELNYKLFNTVKFVEVDKIKKPAGATRFTAFSECKTNTVYINRSQNTQPTLGIVLHEALGALCIEDTNYQVSSLLAIVVQMHSSNKPWLSSGGNYNNRLAFWGAMKRTLNGDTPYKNSLIETLASQHAIHRNNQRATVQGSGTIIGEAGDALAQEIKIKLILNYFSHRTSESASLDARGYKKFFQLVNLVIIERVPADKIKYKIVKAKDSKWDNRYYFYVPTGMSTDDAATKIFDSMYMIM